MFNNVIKPGDKIDIKHLHQNNQKVYKSSVFDIMDDGMIEITIPTDQGKMILFQNGTELQFYFYSGKGIYTCEASIVDRYKRGSFLLFLVTLTTPVKKFQRREYFRLNCLIDFSYFKITDEVAELETAEDLFDEICKPEYFVEKRLARTKDLSGGGIRFIASEPLEIGTKLLSLLPLSNSKVDRMFYLVTDVISCVPVENMQDRWIVRGKFLFKNLKERDLIVQYVFEEDRMLRKKENGK